MRKRTTYPGRIEAVAAMEAAASRKIKYYFSDWTEYDRPQLMDPDKTPSGTYYQMFRECGSYLLRPATAPGSAWLILDHYTDPATAPKNGITLYKLEISPGGGITISPADKNKTLDQLRNRLFSHTVEAAPGEWKYTIFSPEGKPIGEAEKTPAGIEFYSFSKAIDRREIREIYYRLKTAGQIRTAARTA